MKWIDKIKTMSSGELARLLCTDFEHTCCCNVCYYKDDCCDLCEIGIKLFFESEYKDEHNA